MEVIICTPSISGHTAPDESAKRSTRGQGDEPKNKSNLKERRSFNQKQKTIYSQTAKSNSIANFATNLKTLRCPAWVGGFVGLSLCASLFLVPQSAHAASLTMPTSGLMGKLVADVAPTISADITDQTVAPDPAYTTNDFIEKPIVADTQITPEPKVLAYAGGYSLTSGPHPFPYGYCTYYVSQKRTVTWSGNASSWLAAAAADGKAIGDTPQPGAIMVTSEGGRTGHVAYVEAVSGDSFTVSEMNYKGFGIVSSRTISDSAGFIRGYIY